jgi:hypothetical protein
MELDKKSPVEYAGSIEIDAPIEREWQIMADIERWPQCNNCVIWYSFCMTEVHKNWVILNEKGITAESSIDASALRLERLDKDTAVRIGHALTQHLDGLSDTRRYASYSLEMAQADAEVRLQDGENIIFGETRPANRNCAVRVENTYTGECRLKAVICNDFEDRPELGGGKILQQAFVETIESIEL